MEPNYSRHALIWAFCLSITRGVTLAFQSSNVCFEICDNQSRLPFVTACSVWCGGKKAWPIAMEEFPCFLFNSSKLSSSVPLPHCTQMITTACVRGHVCWIAWCFGGRCSRYVLRVWANVCVSVCHRWVDKQVQVMSVCVCECRCLVAAESQREIKQSVSYFERTPVGVTERGRLNIWDQIVFSACHIMRQLHQAQTKHTEWSNTGHRLGSGLKLCHDARKEHSVHHRACFYPALCCTTVKHLHGALCVSRHLKVQLSAFCLQ